MDALNPEDWQSADGQAVAALFNLRTGDRERFSGLYRRGDAVPLQVKQPR
ncbi:hypothetical protein [Deinococcus sp. QL22]|nr:hypothetical protein [Deinococcus sp. QL22]UQN10105.1 hypothetical protein M1R55_28355 [Deinococcus sp. QL22]